MLETEVVQPITLRRTQSIWWDRNRNSRAWTDVHSSWQDSSNDLVLSLLLQITSFFFTTCKSSSFLASCGLLGFQSAVCGLGEICAFRLLCFVRSGFWIFLYVKGFLWGWFFCGYNTQGEILSGEGDEKRRADRSHVVEVKAFSCLSGAPYPSLSDVTLQHPYTVTLPTPLHTRYPLCNTSYTYTSISSRTEGFEQPTSHSSSYLKYTVVELACVWRGMPELLFDAHSCVVAFACACVGQL